jgi:hypothetical protein
MLDKLLSLVALSGTAVVFADVLVRPGMLLEPVQRWLRTKYRWCDARSDYPVFVELDEQWWWPPLWGCYKCVAGQWGFWGYLIRYHAGYSWRTLPEHLAFTAFTILAAISISKWSQD